MSLKYIATMLTRFLFASSLVVCRSRPVRCFSMLSASRGNRSGAGNLVHATAVTPTLSSWLDQWPMSHLPASSDVVLHRFLGDMMNPRSFARLELDIKESPEKLEIQVDVPGVEKKDIKLTVVDHVLKIETERHGIVKTDNEQIHRVERFSGHTSRSLALPPNAEEDNISATSEHGVLHITIPKNKTPESPSCEKAINIK